MCRIFVCRNEIAEPAPSLWAALCALCPPLGQGAAPTIAFTGSGGKTTWLYALAQELRFCRGPVLIATTTHMYEPKRRGVFSGGVQALAAQLKKEGIAVAGVRNGAGKIGYIGDEALLEGKKLCRAVLVEADGSRRLPVKRFGDDEPVLPLETDCIVHIAGLSALGQKVGDACFRWQEGDCDENDIVTEERFSRIVKESLARLRKRYALPVVAVLNQGDDAAAVKQGAQILARIGEKAGLVTSFAGAGEERR